MLPVLAVVEISDGDEETDFSGSFSTEVGWCKSFCSEITAVLQNGITEFSRLLWKVAEAWLQSEKCVPFVDLCSASKSLLAFPAAQYPCEVLTRCPKSGFRKTCFTIIVLCCWLHSSFSSAHKCAKKNWYKCVFKKLSLSVPKWREDFSKRQFLFEQYRVPYECFSLST